MTNPAELEADIKEVARLASLPEHEWRIAIVRLIQDLRHNVDDNTEICANMEEAVNRDLGEIKDILNTVKSGLTFLGWIGVAAKWLGIIAGCLAAVFGAILAGDNLWDAFHKLPSIIPKR